jgi:hypothetical protein
LAGIVLHGELDDRVLEALRSLTETVRPEFSGWLLAAEKRLQDAITILAEFMRADMSRIRNKSAYLSGVISRFKNDRYLNSIQCVFNSISLILNRNLFQAWRISQVCSDNLEYLVFGLQELSQLTEIGLQRQGQRWLEGRSWRASSSSSGHVWWRVLIWTADGRAADGRAADGNGDVGNARSTVSPFKIVY